MKRKPDGVGGSSFHPMSNPCRDENIVPRLEVYRLVPLEGQPGSAAR
jgi:hypothetical protein